MDIFSEEQFITKPEPTTSRSHKFFKTLTCSTDIQGNCYYAQKNRFYLSQNLLDGVPF